MKSGLLLAIIMAAIEVHAADVDLSPETTPVSNIEDLRGLLRESQARFFMPSIPSTDQILWDVRGESEDIFVDWFSGGWPESATKLAVATLDKNMIPRIEIHLWESPETGLITIENMSGETMATLKPEKGFDSLGWAYDYFETSELTAFQQIIHASWHSALSLTLTPYLFAEVCAGIREEEAVLAEQASSLRYEEEGMAMMSMGAGVELQMDIDRLTNGTVEVFVEWLSSLDSDSLDLFLCSDLISADWQLETNFPTASSTNFYFQDLETNQTARFYVTGTMYDEDLDGLTSARERYLHKTREDLFSTDSDGLGDGWEIGYGFDPFSIAGNNGALGDTDGDGYSNLEEQLNGTDPGFANSNSNTGTVATIRYYYGEDDHLTDFFCGTEVAQKTILTAVHNIAEDVSAK